MKKILAIGFILIMILALIPYAAADDELLWKDAYRALLENAQEIGSDSGGSDSALHSYLLYDIDKNGIPEIILHFGTSTAGSLGRLYRFENGMLVMMKEFGFGGSYFASYPDKNGILFKRARMGGQHVNLWTMDGDSITESQNLFEETVMAAQYTQIGEIIPGAADLTEFPADTLFPLESYERWQGELEPDGIAQRNQLRYPENDPDFFKRAINGQIKVIPGLVAEEYYERWEKPESRETFYPEAELSMAMNMLRDLIMSGRGIDAIDFTKRMVSYADLDGDGQLEAVCSLSQELGQDRELNLTVILHEQDGRVYAHGLIGKCVEERVNNGVFHIYHINKSTGTPNEYTFKLVFDGENCFYLNVPRMNYISAVPNGMAAPVRQNPFQNAYAGDTVLFGRYEQDNNGGNGPEDITWRVLERTGDRVLVVSEYALDCQPFNKTYTVLTWENSSLRRWLNETFMKDAFSPAEQGLILRATVAADKNPQETKSDPGNETVDQVFLLSIKEISQYFIDDYRRFCTLTPYAASQGGKIYPNNYRTCWWWTRTPGCDNYYFTNVNGDGTINYIGGSSDISDVCVRPAMWINLTA